MIRQLYELYKQHPVVSTDSRTCPEGAIFFALHGERFDGNQFAAEVLARGAAIAVVDDPSVVVAGAEPNPLVAQPSVFLTSGQHGRYFLVDDVLAALQQLAAYHREQFRLWRRPVPVVGITGTNGKTTTKELLAAVLGRRYSVLATEGNLNNQIGVPLTLLCVAECHDLAIVEMGANHPMDIAQLCSIARPDYGLITNVGKAHLAGFGSLEGVVEAKTKLYDAVRDAGGTIFVDGGNALLTPRAEGAWVVRYGTADSRVRGAVEACNPMLEVNLSVNGTAVSIATHLIGAYNLINIVAAAAVGTHFGVTPDEIKAAVEAYVPRNMRSQLVDLGHGRRLVLDAYNANPTSMRAALDSLNAMDAPHKSAILGSMGELGADSDAEHKAVLDYLMQPDVSIGDVLLVGEAFGRAFRALDDAALLQLGGRRSVRCYANVDSLVADGEVLRRLPGTILVKGSRSQHLERVAAFEWPQ